MYVIPFKVIFKQAFLLEMWYGFKKKTKEKHQQPQINDSILDIGK